MGSVNERRRYNVTSYLIGRARTQNDPFVWDFRGRNFCTELLIFCWFTACVTSVNSLRPVTHKCVGNLTIIGSDNGLSPGRCQTIIWTNAVILLIEPLRTYFREMLTEIQPFSFKKMDVKMSSAKRRPFCLGLIEARGQLKCHCVLCRHDKTVLKRHTTTGIITKDNHLCSQPFNITIIESIKTTSIGKC